MSYEKTFRSEKLRRAVSTLPCQLCGLEGNTQVAHCDMGKGMGIKSSDATVAALCVRCHAELGHGGSMSKADRRCVEAELNLKTLRLMVETGMLKIS